MKTVIVLLIFAIKILPQSFQVMGTVADSASGEILSSANIILIQLPDSTTKGTATDSKGAFLFDNLPEKSYILIVSYVGYKKSAVSFTLRGRSMDLERILLSPGESTLDDIEIVERRLPVIQNADTTEYSAEAFKTHKDADAEELVSKMPGITVTDGKVKAQGEEVKKVLVDGRTFFGDDPTAVLRNLPAEVIDRIQVFDEQSEQAKFTGFEDGNTSKTMNVVTRNRIREGSFGKFTAGYGDDNRYSAGANYNKFNNDQRISFVGQLNNINEQNFSREDLAGVMVSSGRGGGMGFRLGGGFGGGFSGGGPGLPFGRGPSDFLVTSMNGLSATKALGINYSDKFWESLSMQGSYFINSTDNEAESNVQREYFLQQAEGQKYYEDNRSNSSNINHRFNMRVDYQIDTLNDLTFRPRFSLQQNDGSSNLYGRTFTDISELNSINSLYSSDISAINSSAELLYRHRFETRGRTFSIALNGSYNNNGGDSRSYSENIFYVNSLLSDTLDQVSDLYRDGKGISSNIMYTEPAGEYGMFQLTSGLSFKKDQNDQQRFGINGNNSVLDSSLSNVAVKNYNTQTYGTGYRYQKEDLSFNVNLNYNISVLGNDQKLPYSISAERKFTSILPSMMMRYNISRDKSFNLFYRTNNNEPAIEQLQDVLDNSNPIQMSIGNPDLRQDYRHSLNLRYMSMDMESYNSVFLMLNGSYTDDYIGTSTIIAGRDTMVYRGIVVNPGAQISTPANLNGFFNIGSSIVFSRPIQFIKSILNLNLDANYSRIPGMINYNEGFSSSNAYTLGITISSNISREIDFTLSSRSSYNKVSSNLRNNFRDESFNEFATLRLRVQFLESFIFNSNINYQYDNGLPEDYDRNMFLWNLSIGKKIFSKNQGEIRLSAYDILNKNTNFQSTNTAAYIQDVRSNTIGRYFILSFVYQLRAFSL
jgi:hypothetical protein